MEREIKLLKNNQKRDWSGIEWITEFYNFLQGEVPETIRLGRGHKPRLTAAQANTVIWYLQEHFALLPDHIEQCSSCKEYFDSYSQGHHSELTGKHYCCESCEPPGLYEREERAAKRRDAPFRKWLKQVKKEQKNYPLFKGKEISEEALRNLFWDEKSPIDALNDLSTLV
jgi:hypothetical protein